MNASASFASKMRNHRLRERRLKLGVSQYLVGLLAGYRTGTAQHYVSAVECGRAAATHIERVRKAIIWLETEPRRKRNEDRIEAAEATLVEEATKDMRAPANKTIIIQRLVDLLCDGRTEDFDALAAQVPSPYADEAGNIYLDGVKVPK